MKSLEKEIKNILINTKDGNKVIEYIEKLQNKIAHLEEHCEHHHHENCECGCHDEEENEWQEIKTPYKNKLTVKDWENLLNDKTIFNKDSLIIMKRMRHIAAPTSNAELADMFGFGAMYYKMEIDKLAKRIEQKLNIADLKEYSWSILFDGWENSDSSERIFALNSELYEALGNIDLSTIALR